jgi:AAA ATPase domain
VNTGEVVTGTAERLATGDAVNVAARLEQAAAPGEVLIGEATHALVRGAVVAESLEPLTLKGKSEPTPALRLVSVLDAPERSHASRFVGRERELAQILQAWERVHAQPRCELVTVVGDAGVGKSRLVAEALAAVEARVVRGRCLPYGEGITYWPVVEVVKQLAALPSDSAAAAAIRSLLGESDMGTTGDEIAWAFRKLLEELAPIVVVFDDIQWGEETFLDLVESTALLSAGAPLLLLCIGRPELLERRPSWPAALRLDPLPAEQADALIGDAVSGELRERLARAAGGNPLFISEMLAMAAGDGDVDVPPTLKALLAARLDQVDEAERRVLERGSVEGEIFHRGAVQALAPEETQVTTRLAGLVRRELIRPERAQLAGEDGYRFRHLLIRDAAYDALPKLIRADLHERFADWLRAHSAELVELDEIVGYHLEQAYRYRIELGSRDEAAHALAARAAEHLLVSGERARARGDSHGGQALLEHAVDLLPADSPARREAQVELAVLLTVRGDFPRAAALQAEAEAAARGAGDDRILARLRLARIETELLRDPTATMRDLLMSSEQALVELERVGDDGGAVWALRLIGNFMAWQGSTAGAQELWARALARAERVSPRLANDIRMWSMWALWWGPTPTDEGIRRCDEFLRQSTSRRVEATVLLIRGNLKAARRHLEEGRAESAAGRQAFKELGDLLLWAGMSMVLADTELLIGANERAYELLTEGHTLMEGRHETGYLATVVGMRAQAALELGRDGHAVELADEALRVSQPDDFEPLARIRLVRARALARRGEFEASDRLIREATEILEPTDYVQMHLELAFARADVEHLAGRRDGERQALERALEVAEAKGNLVAADRARERLAEQR